MIANKAIRDQRLSFRARGLHHLLLSYPNGWKVQVDHLVGESEKDGKDAVASALKELESLGYLTRTQIRVKGKIVGCKSVIRELSLDNPPAPKGRRGKKKQDLPQPDLPDTVEPQPDLPDTAKPELAKPEHNKYLINEVSREEVSREEVSIPPNPQNQNREGENKKSQSVEVEVLKQTHFSDNKSETCNSPITSHEDGYSAPALQNVYTRAKDVYELIDLFLLSPETSDAPPPTEMMSVFREKAKWHGWVLPWRSLKIHHEFQNCNPEIVCSLAADLARKDKATPAQKYGHAIATINQWEKTKGGWVNLMVLCDRPIADEPTLSETSQQLSIPQYIRDWYESQHEYHYRTQYLKSASLEDFFKGKDNQAWWWYAKEKFPSWDWTKINSKNEDKTLCLLKMS
ncbi:MAG: hypothetical protein ACKPIX_18860 [Dolichospermum sp.]